MPEVLQASKVNVRLPDSLPLGTSGGSDILALTFQSSVRSLSYHTFSYPPYWESLYALGPSEIILPTLKSIYHLLALPDGWDGYEGCAPSYNAVEYANHWIILLYKEVLETKQKWLSPNVTASYEGEVVFEWWQSNKKLTMYVGNQSAEYVKVWGPNINTMMEDGEADTPALRLSLWQWLMS